MWSNSIGYTHGQIFTFATIFNPLVCAVAAFAERIKCTSVVVLFVHIAHPSNRPFRNLLCTLWDITNVWTCCRPPSRASHRKTCVINYEYQALLITLSNSLCFLQTSPLCYFGAETCGVGWLSCLYKYRPSHYRSLLSSSVSQSWSGPLIRTFMVS